MSLNLDIDIGDSIRIGESRITLIHKTGRKARLSIDADKKVDVTLISTSSSGRGDKGKQARA